MPHPFDDHGAEGPRAVLAETLEAASTALGRGALTPVGDPFPGSDRALVVRARVGPGGDTVVLKRYFPERSGEAWVREAAALAALSSRPGMPAPRLLAEAAEPQLVVMSDIGDGPHLARLLLGRDRVAASRGLEAWARTLGAFQARAVGLETVFAEELRAREGDLPVDTDTSGALVAQAAGGLVSLLSTWGIEVRDEAVAELRALGSGWRTDATGLTPADVCPDNNVVTPAAVVLLDFEGATVRHLAWETAYLTVPWPTCWCAWHLPADAVAGALHAWREAVAVAVPVVRSPEFGDDLRRAGTLWSWVTLGWFLPRVMGADSAPLTGKPSPSMRARLQHGLRTAGEAPDTPNLSALAAEALTASEQAWGPLEVRLAPAFR